MITNSSIGRSLSSASSSRKCSAEASTDDLWLAEALEKPDRRKEKRSLTVEPEMGMKRRKLVARLSSDPFRRERAMSAPA